MFDLDKAVATWRRYFEHNPAFLSDDVDELEAHLRDHVETLRARGLAEETAFHEAVRRLGDYARIETEYHKIVWRKRTHRIGLRHTLILEIAMLKNYLKIALRGLKKRPGMSFIHISGLALGMACCLVTLLFVRDELRYDRYHALGDRLYRLSLYATTLSTGESGPGASSSILWGPTLQHDFPEVEAYARFVRLVDPDDPWTIRHGERAFDEAGLLHADPAALQLFSWPLLQGNPATALAEPNGIVLSRSMARKYFGDADPMGRTLTIDPHQRDETGAPTGMTADFVVTGVLEDIPRTSHFTFDFLLPFQHLDEIFGGDVTTGDGLDRWFWRGRIAHTYLLLQPAADPAALEARLDDFLERYVGDETRARGYDYALFLQPLPDIYLDGDSDGQLAPVGNVRTLYMLALIAAFILLIACINYTNLATARAAQRAREVGLRKVVGAGRRQLVAQFLGESVLISLVSVLVGVVLARLLMPMVYDYLGKPFVFDYASGFLAASLLGIALLVGLAAGSYPAFFLSRFQPVQVLKGAFHDARSGGWLRKGLVVFQFAVSTFLIIATLTIREQLRYMNTRDLGFDQERVLYLPPETMAPLHANYTALRNALLADPQVAGVTVSSALPGLGGGGDIYVERGRPADEGIGLPEGWVAYNFIDFYGLDLIAGRAFSETITTDAGYLDADSTFVVAAVLNEEAVRQFGWASPEDALGKEIVRDPRSVDHVARVVGVVRDFHVETLERPIVPLALLATQEAPRPAYLSVRLRPGDPGDAIAHVRRAVAQIAPGAGFDYGFLDQSFRAQYESEQRLSEIFTYVSLLAIFIACLGLFGLATFTAEQRTKEIGVRKVLGATASGITLLLTRDFLKLVLVGCLVAAPLGYLAARAWLQDFAYRVDLGAGPFVLAALLALAIALLPVGYQSLRAALADPVKSLRYE